MNDTTTSPKNHVQNLNLSSRNLHPRSNLHFSPAARRNLTSNYNISSVSSGEEAVAYLKEHEIDLMVLDMIMDPGMDGLDTYRSIIEIRPKQKAIIVSGFSESDRVKTAEGIGVGAYVRKPYIKEKLGLAVRRELDRK